MYGFKRFLLCIGHIYATFRGVDEDLHGDYDTIEEAQIVSKLRSDEGIWHKIVDTETDTAWDRKQSIAFINGKYQPVWRWDREVTSVP